MQKARLIHPPFIFSATKEANMIYRAPAKLILSGEHAVVHGAPALAMAINYYATTEAIRQTPALVSLTLPDLHYQESWDTRAFEEIRAQVEQRYKLFQQDQCAIDKVLTEPAQLLVYALSIILPVYQIKEGMRLSLTSTIPIGCGMGSSAASIVSIMYAATTCAGYDLSPLEIYPLALTAENMQHGQSSGLDVLLALRGGCIYRHDGMLSPRKIATMPLYLVNTGVPAVSTGQCVAAVESYFNGEKDNLIDDFAAVTNAMDRAWQANSIPKMRDAIRSNHELLIGIGVVPEKIQQFIAELEQQDAAAKICGAGATSGEQAGAVMVLTEDKHALTVLCDKYGYDYAPVIGETRGVHEL
jgi:mevalonate kinase